MIVVMTILKTDNITKIYGGNGQVSPTNALNGIDLKIEEGEFVGIMGSSGSGKTTLLNVMSGLMAPTTGDVSIHDTAIHRLSRDELALFRRRHIGFVFQDFNLLDSLTLKENILLPMALDKRSLSDMEARSEDLVSLMGLVDVRNKYPYQVSGGQVQRACIARALINHPSMVFADEPTGNLDSKITRCIMEYFEKINQERNITIVLVTHDPYSASFCNRIVFIKDGLINMEIRKKAERREFFERILDCLAVLGGEKLDLS